MGNNNKKAENVRPLMSKLFILATICCALLPFCQQVSAMTLEEAVVEAIQKHPVVQAAEAAMRASGYAVQDAEAGYYPSFDIQGDAGRQYANNSTTRGRGEGGETTLRRSVEFKLTQNLFDGFAIRYRVEATEKQAELARYQLMDSQEVIALRTVEAYLAVLRGRLVLTLYEENIHKHRQVLKDVSVKAKKGGGSLGDVSQAESRLALAEAGLTLAKGELRDAEASFLEAVGVASDSLVHPGYLSVPVSLDEALEKAVLSNPTILAAMAAIESSEADLKSADAAFMPALDLELTETRSWDTDGLRERTVDRRAVAVMTFNLFRGWGDIAKKGQARESLTQSQWQRDESVRLVKKQLRVDFSAYETARDRAEALKVRALASEKAVQAYKSQFRFGTRSMLDVLDLENELFQSKVALVDVDTQHRLARYRIMAIMGGLLESLDLGGEAAVSSHTEHN
ncbi:MAG: TolC family outer membrane protein [Magnetococcales bacterium]|nr:TolC family outer membrane protein [Magnetococcales bacterium]